MENLSEEQCANSMKLTIKTDLSTQWNFYMCDICFLVPVSSNSVFETFF